MGHRTQCRMCHKEELFTFLDLGYTPPADGFLSESQLNDSETWYPLRACCCQHCGLVQLDHVVSPEVLYQNDYPYESSTTRSGREHWASFAKSVSSKYRLEKESVVVDIGSNVGVLLRAFKDLGMTVHGLDPATNIVDIANENGIDTICAFIGPDASRAIVEKVGRASVAVTTNVFAHVDDLDAFMEALEILLKEDGIFVLEAPYLLDLIDGNEYDTIYHEHLGYLSVKPLVMFFDRFNMDVIDVEHESIHGGSIRVSVSRRGVREPSESVQLFLDKEESKGVYTEAVLNAFRDRVMMHREELRELLLSLKRQGKNIAAVSAPAKGMTLLNFCGLDSTVLSFATEKSNLKIGKFTPGGHVPVLPDSALLEYEVDYALLLAWNFSEEIMQNMKSFSDAGGKFIIPIPQPRIV